MTMALPIAAEAAGGLVGAGGAAAGTGAAGAGAAAGAEGAGGAAVRSAAGRQSVTARTGVKPTSPKTPADKPPASGRTGKGSASSSASDSAKSKKGPDRGRSLKIPKFSGLKGGSGAHKLVIAEFILCVVLIGIAPILVRPPAPDGSGREHVYLANDFVRLSATCLLFFVLALMANQPRSAKFAAAFGGLVVLGAAFNANKAFIAVSSLFTTPKTATP
jgi:hypothetical protein